MFDFIFSWTFLWYLILIVYVPACFGLIIVVLLQKGKGVGFAGAFGAGGGTETVFGPRTSKSLPQKLTYTMAGLFMFLALIMSMLSDKVGRGVAPEEVELTREERAAGLLEEALNDDLQKSTEPAASEAAPAPAEASPPAETAPEAAAPVVTEPTEEVAPAGAVETPETGSAPAEAPDPEAAGAAGEQPSTP